jgi:hypothetical protein
MSRMSAMRHQWSIWLPRADEPKHPFRVANRQRARAERGSLQVEQRRKARQRAIIHCWPNRGDEPCIQTGLRQNGADGDTPVIELVAVRILELAYAGEFDPDKLTATVVAEFGA